MFIKPIYTTLTNLAMRLGLPQPYLKSLAEEKRIPSLNVNGRLRFSTEAVQRALDKIAAGASSKEEKFDVEH